MERMLKILQVIFSHASGLAIFCVGMVMLLEVVFRYIPWFTSAQAWVADVLYLSLIWLIYLGSVPAMGMQKHLRIDFLVKMMPTQARRINEFLVDIVTLGLLVTMTFYSIPIVVSGMDIISGSAPFSRGYSFIALPISTGFMSLIVFWRIVNRILQRGKS